LLGEWIRVGESTDLYDAYVSKRVLLEYKSIAKMVEIVEHEGPNQRGSNAHNTNLVEGQSFRSDFKVPFSSIFSLLIRITHHLARQWIFARNY